MLLPIKPVGILPNFQSSKTQTHPKSALLHEQPKDGQGKSWIHELLPCLLLVESEPALPQGQALQRLQALRGDDQTHSTTSPLLQPLLLHTQPAKVFFGFFSQERFICSDSFTSAETKV